MVSHADKTVAYDSKTLKFLAELFELSSVEKYDLRVTYTELAIADAGIPGLALGDIIIMALLY